MKRMVILFAALWCSGLGMSGQPQSQVTVYDEEDGVPHGHVTQLLQDEAGFMWFATWNGLCRYDGYEFHTFKPQAGDGCHMTTDRFRDIALRPDGRIICRVDDDYFLFDTHSCRFSNMTEEEAKQAADDIKHYRMSKAQKEDGKRATFSYTDRQGNLWTTTTKGITKQTVRRQHTTRLDIEPKAEVKCLFTDAKHRYWVCTKGDAAVRIYNGSDDRLLGYLGADGKLHAAYTCFGANVYSMYQSADGTLWLGTKPDGLFRLHETADGQFRVEHFTNLPCQNVYDMVEDRYGRLWVATLNGGLCYTATPQAAEPAFVVPKGYPEDVAKRLHRVLLVQGGSILVGAATDGIVVARLEKKADDMRFLLHQRESDRAGSMSSSATIDMIEDGKGRLFVGTESGGINSIGGSELLNDKPTFLHYTADSHQLPTDVVVSLTPLDKGRMMVVSNYLISMLDTTGVERVIDTHYFNEDYRFTEAHPQPLSDGRWLFGLMDGAFVTSEREMYEPAYKPSVVLTGISIQGSADNWAVAATDTLTLQPRERSMTIHFAALDFSDPDRISYSFRLLPHQEWTYIGHGRSATLLDLKPGIYQMEIRSTDADGKWLDNTRRLTIIVKPTFWESAFGQVLLQLLIFGGLALIVYTLLYIRRIKRKQQEMLEKYLAMLEQHQAAGEQAAEQAQQQDEAVDRLGSDPMLQRLMQFIDENISNSDINVGDMASAVATSRSGLQRKLKKMMGITPQDLLREARIKHAIRLLRTTTMNVAEVAYASGFSDPKYFSRCFKQSVGSSPSEYRATL